MMKAGDLVTDNRNHIEKTNIFYNSWLRIGIILSIENNVLYPLDELWATIIWTDSKKQLITQEPLCGLETINEA